MVHLIIINLDRRKDRLLSLLKHLEDNKTNLGFIEDIHRLSAVDQSPCNTYIFTPAKGCMLSHINAILFAKEKGLKNVMVIEDDARFASNANEIFNTAMSTLEKRNWSTLFGATVTFQQKGFKKPNFEKNKHLLELKNGGIMTGTHCIVYNSTYFDTIVELINKEIQTDAPYHLDMLLSLNLPYIYLTVPYMALFVEHDTSDIRIGKNTSSDYQQVIEAQRKACEIME